MNTRENQAVRTRCNNESGRLQNVNGNSQTGEKVQLIPGHSRRGFHSWKSVTLNVRYKLHIVPDNNHRNIVFGTFARVL